MFGERMLESQCASNNIAAGGGTGGGDAENSPMAFSIDTGLFDEAEDHHRGNSRI